MFAWALLVWLFFVCSFEDGDNGEMKGDIYIRRNGARAIWRKGNVIHYCMQCPYDRSIICEEMSAFVYAITRCRIVALCSN